jgi:ABC-type nitrate/sulfonate/bicarbonate transport system permease component
MAVTTVAALDQVPEDLRLCGRTLGASPLFTLLHVQVRAALPGIITGMRICMAGAWTSIVAVELCGVVDRELDCYYLFRRAAPDPRQLQTCWPGG